MSFVGIVPVGPPASVTRCTRGGRSTCGCHRLLETRFRFQLGVHVTGLTGPRNMARL